MRSGRGPPALRGPRSVGASVMHENNPAALRLETKIHSAQLAEGEGKTHRGTTPKALSYQPETAAEYFDYTPAWKQAFGGGRQLGSRTLLIVIPTLTSEGPRRRTFRCVWTCRDVERSRSYVRSVVFPPACIARTRSRRVPLSPAFSVRVRDDNTLN